MKLHQRAWKLHKYLSYLLFAQLFFWVLGGVVFATVPFDALVKGGDFVRPLPTLALPEPLPQTGIDASRVAAQVSARGPLLRYDTATGVEWRRLDGTPPAPVTAEQVQAFAVSLYAGAPVQPAVHFLTQVPARMAGLVQELGERRNVWLADFGEARLYFDEAGQYLTVRTDYWVWYDALWRLHIMDYRGGEDFNNGLLRLAVWLALLFVGAGMIMSFFAARRQLAGRRALNINREHSVENG